MPTFTAIALDRLIEPRASKMAPSTESPSPAGPNTKPLERHNSTPSRMSAAAAGFPEDFSRPVRIPPRRPALPPPRPNLARGNSMSSPTADTVERKASQWPQISPALYATPEAKPLPDSPTSSSPSPYVINHKRRGPRLLQKSSSEANVLRVELLDDKLSDDAHLRDAEADETTKGQEMIPSGPSKPVVEEEKKSNGFHGEKNALKVNVHVNGTGTGNRNCVVVGAENGDQMAAAAVPSPSSLEREFDIEDFFFDPQESMSFSSNTDGEDFGYDRSARAVGTPMGEFYDAFEELSSDSGRHPQSTRDDLEAEIRELRLSLLMEIEKRKLTEDAINSMQNQWQVYRQKLREVGLVLPELSSSMAEYGPTDVDSAEDICQQVNIARFVSEAIGRGAAKAECEEDMEAQLEWKDFEIARLCDRLHYYETMNREMTQRNQESVEAARRDRQRRKRTQKWFWGSVAATITVGTAALAWSYLPSSPSSSSSTPDSDSK